MNGGQGDVCEKRKEQAALDSAGAKLSEAATAFKELQSPSDPVLLLKEEIKDVLTRVKAQRDQMEG